VRIAQVAPLFESVPPKKYGGTERVVSYLTEELVRRGHDVTLFATADSVTSARLIAGAPQGLRLAAGVMDPIAPLFPMLEAVCRVGHEFDIIHYHVDYFHYPFSRRSSGAHVTTLHGRLDLPELRQVYREYADIPLVSISDAQRRPVPRANWQATVHHGMPLAAIPFEEAGRDYLVFLGRFSPVKGPERAIEIAKKAGVPLRMMGKVDKADAEYFEEVVRPLIRDSGAEFLGEGGEADKRELFSNAAAFLFPIDWPEPFGMVVIEAMAAGVPTIAFPHGSVPELLADPRSGIVVPDVQAAVKAVPAAIAMDRRAVRAAFEEHFSVERMVDDYLDVYENMIAGDGAGHQCHIFPQSRTCRISRRVA
jgi:glycosyltransferase involved in cell wall biosynthesis